MDTIVKSVEINGEKVDLGKKHFLSYTENGENEVYVSKLYMWEGGWSTYLVIWVQRNDRVDIRSLQEIEYSTKDDIGVTERKDDTLKDFLKELEEELNLLQEKGDEI